jgi:hypothetical protein
MHTFLYTDCMSDTTIRLDSSVRDKLRALAAEDGVALGDLIARLAEREQYQRDMRGANDVMDTMRREDPAAWQEYRSELDAFDTGTARDGIGTGAAEWSEYNNDMTGGAPGAVSGR